MKSWIEFRRAMRNLANARVSVRVEIENPSATGMALGLVCRIGEVQNGRVQLLGVDSRFQDMPWKKIHKVELINHCFERQPS